jgi:GntR family transcriptional regulator, rspAB operon transcriptional repressor
MELTAIRRVRASDEVYRSLRQAILTAVFQPGERLQVEDIAAKLGVSPTPVKSAIQQLSTEGLVEVRPRSGTFVAQLTAVDIRETAQIRCALECLAAELAVVRITEEELHRLKEILLRLAQPVDDETKRHHHEKDNTEFHQLLIQFSGNARLIEMYESLNAHLQIARAHGRNADWQQRLGPEAAEHSEIFSALAARDSARLSMALRKHILRAGEDLSQSLSVES